MNIINRLTSLAQTHEAKQAYAATVNHAVQTERYSVVGSQVKNKKALERRTQIKRELVDQLGGCCARCGYDESLAALDFHHTDGTKEGQIARLITGAVYRGLTDLTKEVSKCVVLCSNCHRTLHAGEWR